jgi:hypothetical protein
MLIITNMIDFAGWQRKYPVDRVGEQANVVID